MVPHKQTNVGERLLFAEDFISNHLNVFPAGNRDAVLTAIDEHIVLDKNPRAAAIASHDAATGSTRSAATNLVSDHGNRTLSCSR
ncbi:MAG: hypothetical protein JWM68_5580 [Verrucomicrobiales bacterium]|nr:hypothetical protein [Verrucomicrobiales bacterium]